MTRRKTPRVDQTERNAAIVRLREQKVPYKVIAGHLGITVGVVNAVVRKCFGAANLKEQVLLIHSLTSILGLRQRVAPLVKYPVCADL
jgi:hypothetical protein